MKPVDLKQSKWNNFGVKNIEKDPKLKAGVYIKISKF